MISVTELRSGAVFRLDGQIWQVLKYEHVKMGRGTATIRVRVKNLETGSMVEKSFISGARVEPAVTTRREMTYLYGDADNAVFMNPQTYEQVELSMDLLGDSKYYLKEGMIVQVLFLDEEGGDQRPLQVDLPPKMTFTVAEAEPGVKGDSAANMLKRVKLENGLVIKAPLFIKEGEQIRVDTRTGEYVERA